jgi:hypothetical protein
MGKPHVLETRRGDSPKPNRSLRLFDAGLVLFGNGAVGVDLAGAGRAEAADFAAVIDGACGYQVQGRIGLNQRVEIGQHAVVPDDGPRVAFGVDNGQPDDYAMVVNADCGAGNVAWICAQVLHARGLGPQEGVKRGVAGEIGKTNHLASVVKESGKVSGGSAQCTQINDLAVFPQQCMHGLEVVQKNRIKRGARAGCSGDLAGIVDGESDALGIALFDAKRDGPSVPPDDGSELKFLRSGAVWVHSGVLGLSDRSSPAVNPVGGAVVASERGKRRHDVVVPYERLADEVSAKAAEVLSVGIGDRRFGFTHNLSARVEAECVTVVSAQSSKVGHLSLGPEDGVLIIVGEIGRTGDHVVAVYPEGLAEAAASQGAEIDDVVVKVRWQLGSLLRDNLKRHPQECK